ncbi:MAG: DUF86 domain-containing protein [Mesorhizobium sp.]|nr:DUF86 domain-containing protein [Mesorhizobium sp.]
MSRAEIDRLYDIMAAIDAADRSVGGLTFDDFAKSETLFAALCYFVMVISEASRHISDERKAAYPDLPWRQIADTSNLIRHVYFKIDAERLWNIYEQHLPRLRPVVVDMIAKIPPDQQ